MPEESGNRTPGAAHEVVLTNRERLRIRGVLHVDSFDERQIVLDTDLGTLTIQGEDLQIRQFDLESGDFAVDGTVTSLVYAARARDTRGRARGLLERLLR